MDKTLKRKEVIIMTNSNITSTNTNERKQIGLSKIPADLPMLLDVRTAAQLAGVTPKHIRVLLRNGEIRGIQLGGAWRVNRDAYLAQLGIA